MQSPESQNPSHFHNHSAPLPTPLSPLPEPLRFAAILRASRPLIPSSAPRQRRSISRVKCAASSGDSITSSTSSLHPHDSRPRPSNAADLLRQEEAAPSAAGASEALTLTPLRLIGFLPTVVTRTTLRHLSVSEHQLEGQRPHHQRQILLQDHWH